MGHFFNKWMEAMNLNLSHITRGLPKAHPRYHSFRPVGTHHRCLRAFMNENKPLTPNTESRLMEFAGVTKEELYA